MKTFIRELWELWYWSLFSPLKLNARIQEWVPASTVIAERRLPPPEDEIRTTRFSDIMWWAVQPSAKASRIRAQYVILVILSALPLAAACVALGGLRDLCLWIAITILCLGLGAAVPSVGLIVPWMSAWIYIQSPGIATAIISQIARKLPPASRMAVSLVVIVVILAVTAWTVRAIRQSFPNVAIGILGIGEAGGIAAGTAVIYPNESEPSYLFGAVILFCALVSTGDAEKDADPQEGKIRRMPLGMSVGLAIGLGFAMAAGPGDKTSAVVGIIAMILATLTFYLSCRMFLAATSTFCSQDLGRNLGRCLLWGVVGGFVLPISFHIFIAWGLCPTWVCVGLAYLTGFAVAPSRLSVRPLRATVELLRALVKKNWHGILDFPDAVAQLEHMAWMEVFLFALVCSIGLAAGSGYWAFLCLPATLLGYCRILPDAPLLALTALWRVRRTRSATTKQIVAWLHEMPPYAYDITLLPIPGHARLIVSLFNKNPTIALNAIMCGSAIPWSWAYERTQFHAWLRMEPFVAQLPASERSALVRQSLLARSSAEAIAKFSRRTFPTAILLKDFCDDPETKGAWASNGDIEQFVPLFKEVAAKVEAARAAGHPVEQERGLEAAVADLSSMRTRIRELGVDVDPWLDVIEHWERLLRVSIEALGVPQGELLQPFQAGGALRPERFHLFKGRRQLKDQVISEIVGVGRAPLILHGPRQCGKSSFLLHLSGMGTHGILPVYVDLQSQAITSSESEFCYRLITAAIRDLRGICPRVQQLPKVERAAFQTNPYSSFEDWLDLLLDSIEDNRLLICIDEFEKLGKAMERGHISTAIFDELRHLSQHRDRLRFIFCGAQTFEELGPQWTHYFINSKPIEVLYLEPEEARQLLEDPDPKFGLKYAPGVLDRIIGLTACQPYLVQLVGEAMVKVARTHDTRMINETLLDAAIKEALPAGEFYFASLWAETTGRNAEEVTIGQILLAAIAAKRDLPPLEGPAHAALQRLQRYHVVAKKDDGYRIEIPLVAQWVQERKVRDVLGGTNVGVGAG